MPTYDYECAKCGHKWEVEQLITAEPLKQCPACNEPEAKRLVSGGINFILMGGGWSGEGYGSSK